jgi:hypothetical protein
MGALAHAIGQWILAGAIADLIDDGRAILEARSSISACLPGSIRIVLAECEFEIRRAEFIGDQIVDPALAMQLERLKPLLERALLILAGRALVHLANEGRRRQ